ncbi:MAG: DUF3368 domain-containing protein [Planctomycetaceae bacterium]|nr:DUF3368 domain-containing protein [Planctomycetaceae bacterium]
MAMIKHIAIDTGPLILLAKIDLLSVVAQLPYQFTAPQEVIDELKVGDELGHQVVDAPWLHVQSLITPIPEMIRATLDKGEAAVIQMALENGIRRVCIDDLRGRRIAKAVGLEVIGVLGLLGKAKRRGLIQIIAPHIDKLIEAGAHYSPELIAAVIADVDGR